MTKGGSILVVDVGNSHTVVDFEAAHVLAPEVMLPLMKKKKSAGLQKVLLRFLTSWRLTTRPNTTSDEVLNRVSGLLLDFLKLNLIK